MAKDGKSIFFCKECGYESAKWLGQCPGCKEWNTFVETPQGSLKRTQKVGGFGRQGGFSNMNTALSETSPSRLSDINLEKEDRISTGMGELDRVLGGGIVQGSLILVGGDPGIGKSTLLLQICRLLSHKKSVLYVSGEESLKQIKMRAERIGEFSENFKLLCETDLDIITGLIDELLPELVVIDSIQTMYREDVAAAPGSVSQVRESTGVLLQLAKGKNITVFIVGHVTKEGSVAGPKMLEHMVDTVLYFEGERHASYRILRGVKNRFGSTNEIGVFEMQESGLREVSNPSEFMLAGMPKGASGSAVTCSLEGTRPILLEIQALICRTNFGMPRRTAAGIDYNRVNLLLAVLEKRLGYKLSECDAYVNVTGGIRMNEPSMDLGIVIALISSYRDIPVPENTVVFGEVGLAGEVRGITRARQRVAEARRLGYINCIIPKANFDSVKDVDGITVFPVSNINEAVSILFKKL